MDGSSSESEWEDDYASASGGESAQEDEGEEQQQQQPQQPAAPQQRQRQGGRQRKAPAWMGQYDWVQRDSSDDGSDAESNSSWEEEGTGRDSAGKQGSAGACMSSEEGEEEDEARIAWFAQMERQMLEENSFHPDSRREPWSVLGAAEVADGCAVHAFSTQQLQQVQHKLQLGVQLCATWQKSKEEWVCAKAAKKAVASARTVNGWPLPHQ
jgi:hypothetical protein